MKYCLPFILLFSIGAAAQLPRYDSFAATTTSASGIGNLTQVIPNATITVFNYPGVGVSCSGGGCVAATTYTNRTGATACGGGLPLTRPTSTTCLSTADSQGNFGFWAPAGGYQYCIAATNFTTQCYNVVLGTGGNSNVAFVDSINTQAWAGADACAWIGSAVSSLPSIGGTVDARGLQGTVTCAGNNFLSGITPKPVKILLAAVTINPTTGFLINAVGWNDLQILGQEGATNITLTANSSSGIILCGSGANSSCVGATQPLLRVHISGITFNGNATCSQTFCGALGVGIQTTSCQFCEIDHIRGGGTPQPFIYFASDSSSQFAHDNHVHDNWITNVWSSNILFTQFSTQDEIDNNHIFNSHRNAIDVNGTATKIHDNFINNITQSSGDTFDLRGINIFEGGGTNVANTENQIYSNWIFGTDQEGIRVESDDANSGNRTVINNNIITSCGRAAGTGTTATNGLSVTTATAGNMLDLVVIGNIVSTTGKAAVGTGIEIDGITKATINDNIVRNSACDNFHFNNSNSYTVKGNHSSGSRLGASGTCGGFTFQFGGINDVVTANTDDGGTGGNGSYGISWTQNTNPMNHNIEFGNQMLGSTNNIITSGTVSFLYFLDYNPGSGANFQLNMVGNGGTSNTLADFTNAVDQDLTFTLTAGGAGTKFARISPSTNTNLDLGVNSSSVVRVSSGGLGSVGTAATLAGTGACSTRSGQLGGSFAGQVTCTAATAASTLTITPGSTAPNGWTCWANDVTHTLAGSQSTASTTAPIMTFSSVTANDVITFGCNFY